MFRRLVLCRCIMFGLVGHRESVVESRVLQGRDARSV